MAGVHPAGQHPSPPVQAVIETRLQLAEQSSSVPVKFSVVQASASSQDAASAGHAPGAPSAIAESHFSAPVTAESPHVESQSSSFVRSHPRAQQPSPLTHSVMGKLAHCALQFAADPVSESAVHASASSQLAAVGQDEGGSQVSPSSINPLSQLAEQSKSLVGPQPEGQQPSSSTQAIMLNGAHRASQSAAVPKKFSFVQALPSSSQDVAQTPTPSVMAESQLSPLSTSPFPQNDDTQAPATPHAKPGPQSPQTPPQPSGPHALLAQVGEHSRLVSTSPLHPIRDTTTDAKIQTSFIFSPVLLHAF